MSIWGNAITLGGSGGGSGPSASDAILTVTAPAGSTVTATKGGTSLTPTMWTAAADATQECALFVIPAAQFDATTPWTVTATNGTDTASDTVTISENKQYDVELTYFVYIIRHGVMLVDADSKSRSRIEQSDVVSLTYGGAGYGTTAQWALTSDLLNGFYSYSSIVLNVQSWTAVRDNEWSSFGISPDSSVLNNLNATALKRAYGTTFPAELTLSITSIPLINKYLFVATAQSSGSSGGTVKINDLYLTR